MNNFQIQCLPGAAVPSEVYSPQMASSGTAYPADWLFDALAGPWGRSDTGITVNPMTALRHGPVWQAVNILSGDVGQLPLHVMKVTGRNREKFREHPVEWLFNGQPNGVQTPAIWKETMMAWALLWGNACCYIERNGRGEATELVPLLPDRTFPKQVYFETELGERFEFVVIETEVGGKRIPLLYDDVFHIRGLATDGFWGLSVVDVCKNVIGHGMALEKHGNKLFSNGARPSGVLEHPNTLDVEARKNLRKEWHEVHGGIDNQGKVAILWEGMKFNPISMSNEDSQWMEDRKFDREQIASLFNLPAFKLNALENSAVRANLEEQNRDYFNTSLSRHLNKFKEEGERKLFSMQERKSGKVFLRWFPEAFLRGDTVSRFQAYSVAITGQFMSPNEVREKEDMNPYPGGDEFRNPAINPKESTTKEGKEPAKPSNPSDPQQQMVRQLMVTQVNALLAKEAKDLENSVGTNAVKNFCRWAADYYEGYAKLAAQMVELPARIAQETGFLRSDWRKAVESHAQDGLQSLLAYADAVTKVGLPPLVRQRAELVRGMAEQLTDSILGVEQNG